jgi:hypothetical protein
MMKERDSQGPFTVDHLIKVITDKLQSNRAILERSIHHGRLSWRSSKKNGEIEVDLEPKLWFHG